jgi:hypothetical protein
MKRKDPGAVRGPTNRRPAPDAYFEAAFNWRTARLVRLQQLLLSCEGEWLVRRRWLEWTYDGWREIE